MLMSDFDRVYVEFGRLVREHRIRLQLTQEQLAKKVGLSRTSITNIEQGRQKVLLHHVLLLIESLEASAEALLPHIPVVPAAPEIEQKLAKHLKGPEREWGRRILNLGSRKGGVPHAGSKG